MEDKEIVLRQVEQLRALLIAVVAGLDTLGGQLERALASKAPPQPEEVDGQCVHPEQYRIPCPVGRHPHRFVCKRCKAEGGTTPAGNAPAETQ